MKKNYYAKALALTVAASMVSVPAFAAEEADLQAQEETIEQEELENESEQEAVEETAEKESNEAVVLAVEEDNTLAENQVGVSNEEELIAAINGADGTEANPTQIIIQNDIAVKEKITIPDGKHIVLMSEGKDEFQLYPGEEYDYAGTVTNLLTIGSKDASDDTKTTVTLKNITLNGKNDDIFDNAKNAVENGTMDEYVKDTAINNRKIRLIGIFKNATCTMENGVVVKGGFAGTSTGGAIRIYSNGSLVMNGGTITRNIAKPCAGIIMEAEGTSFVMNGGLITENYASSEGAALQMWGGTFTMNDGTFSKNYAYGDSAGAISTSKNNQHTIIINKGVFEDNYAQQYGGAIGVSGSGKNNIEIKKEVVFQSNKATVGGAISVRGSNANVKIDGCQFIGNEVEQHIGSIQAQGGAIYVDNGNAVKVKGATFRNNKVKADGQYNVGGAISVGGKKCAIIQDATFEGNTIGDNIENDYGVYQGILYISKISNKINAVGSTSIIAVLNGGDISSGDDYSNSLDASPFKLATPIKEDCEFEGWYESPDYTGDKVTNPSVGHTYYANWTWKPVIKADGDAVSNNKVEKTYTKEGVTLSVPEVEGARYKWYKDSKEVEDATTNTLNVKNVANSGIYKCVVTVGEEAKESAEVTVTITKATPIIKITPSVTTQRGAGTVTLTVTKPETATGTVTVECDNDITVVEKDGVYTAALPNATRTYTFTASYEGDGNYNAAEDATCTVDVTRKKSSSSSDTSAPTYSVSTGKTENGTISVTPAKAEAGEKVTIKATPDSGYQLDKVTVKDKNNSNVKLTKVSDNEYTFTMPSGKVSVDATFVQKDATDDNQNNAGEKNKVIKLQIGSRIVTVDNEAVIYDVAPVIRNDRTLVPIRIVTETLGGKVDWNGVTKEVTLNIDGKEIKMTVGKTLEKYGVAPVIIDGRTFVPVRFVADELGATVAWDDATKTVTVTKIEK